MGVQHFHHVDPVKFNSTLIEGKAHLSTPREVKQHPNSYLLGRSQNSTWSEKLKHDLLKNYDRYMRPEHDQGVTLVNLSMAFKNVDLDYVTAKLSINSWMSMKWFDPALQWDPKKYGDIKKIYLAPQEVWQPDLSTFNSAGGNDVSPFAEVYHVATSDGQISWVPPCQFQVYCNLDLTYWPFDTQVCELILGSWVYDGNSMDFHFEDDNEIAQYSSLWEITKVTQKRDVEHFSCCTEPYVTLTYTIHTRIKSPAYGTLIFIPTFVIIILTLANFYISPSSSEKFLLCGTTIILTAALLIFFSHKLPLMASPTPIIVMFYTNTLCLLSVSMICCMVIRSLQCNSNMPAIIQSLLRSKLLVNYFSAEFGSTQQPGISPNPYTRLRQDISSIPGDIYVREHSKKSAGSQDIYVTTRMIPDPSRIPDPAREWKKLACLMDKALFYVYVGVFVILAIHCYL
uniref:Acetylcholine receptor subunit alpha-L1 n=1 Tax=Cacopsylla melanoneura TaxID=428564 RepID=A0A8D8RPP1_9HEMI